MPMPIYGGQAGKAGTDPARGFGLGSILRGTGRAFKNIGQALGIPFREAVRFGVGGGAGLIGGLAGGRPAEGIRQAWRESELFRPAIEEVRDYQALQFWLLNPNRPKTLKLPSGRTLTPPKDVSPGELARFLGLEAPGYRVIPLARTAGLATTPEGRKQLGEEPGFVAMDVASLGIGAIARGALAPALRAATRGVQATKTGTRLEATLAPLRAKVSVKGARVGAQVPEALREAEEIVRSRTQGIVKAASELTPEELTELSFRLPRGQRPPPGHRLEGIYDLYETHQVRGATEKLERTLPPEFHQFLRHKVFETSPRGLSLAEELVQGFKHPRIGLDDAAARTVVNDMTEAFTNNKPNPYPQFAKAWTTIERRWANQVKGASYQGRLYQEPVTGEVYALSDIRQIGRQTRKGAGRGGPETIVAYVEALKDNPPARFQTLLEDFKRAAQQRRSGMSVIEGYGPAAVRADLEFLENSLNGNWLEAVVKDLNPVYVHRRALPGPFAEVPSAGPRIAGKTPRSLKSARGLAPEYTRDAVFALLDDEFEMATQQTMLKAVSGVFEQGGGTSYSRQMHKLQRMGFGPAQADKLIKRRYDSIDVVDGKVSVSPADAGKLLVPKEVGTVAKHYLDPQVFTGPAQRLLGAWMVPTLWLAPIFHVNNIIGGALLTAMKTEPNLNVFNDFRQAIQATRQGRILHPGIPKGGVGAPQFRQFLSADSYQQAANLYGRHLSGALKRAVRDPIGSSQRMNQFFDSMYRNFLYLNKRSAGLDDAAALTATKRLFQDWDSMIPIEREIFQRLYPFWGWKRTVIKWALTYPSDHPIRAIVLRWAAQEHNDRREMSEWLDEYLMENMPIGTPDSEGYQTYLGVRGLNVFEDLSDITTFKGWLFGIHPLLSGFGQLLGAEPFVGGVRAFAPAEEIAIDPRTGARVRKPNIESIFQVIPQLRAIQTARRLPAPDEETPEGWMRWLDRYGASLRVTPGITIQRPEELELEGLRIEQAQRKQELSQQRARLRKELESQLSESEPVETSGMPIF